MKKTRRSAFTIVELVIVIAVIAILSAVLIPTFGAIIKDANIAADKAAASSLTSELHVYLKGNTIDSEAELVEALEKSGVGEKLTTKSLAYGYHYWFNMASQSFEVKTSTEVQDIAPAIASGKSDAALMSETDTPVNVTTSFRDIFDKEYYLVDNAGSSYAAYAISLIDAIKNATDFEMIIEDVLGNAIEKDFDTTLANAIKNRLLVTAVHTESGVYFCDNACAYVYISVKATYLSGNYYNYNISSETAEKLADDKGIAPIPAVADGQVPVINIPENINYITDNAFNYSVEAGDTYANVHLYVPSTSTAAYIFSPASTNAYVQLGDQDIIHVITKVTKDAREIDVLKRVDTLVEDDNSYTAILSGDLQFSDFIIGTPDNTDVSTRGEGENRKIYVASKNGTLQLYAINAADPNQTSNRISNWSVVSSNSKGSFEIGAKTGIVDLSTCDYVTITKEDGTELKVCEVQVKATATTTNGVVERTIFVVVAMPVEARLEINTDPLNAALTAPLIHGEENKVTLKFTGDLFAYEISELSGVSYSTDVDGNDAYALATGKSSSDAVATLSVAKKNIVDGLDTIFVYDATKGKLVMNSPDVEHNAKYNLTLLVDNCLPINVEVTAADASKVVVNPLYRHNSTVARPFYIGSGNAITLSDIFKATNAFLEVEGEEDITATLNIYDAVGASGKLSPLYMANRSPGLLSTKITTADGTADLDSVSINAETLSDISLEFFFAENFRGESNDIYIEIIPDNAELNTLVLKFTVVKDAINVFNRDIAGDINDSKFLDDLFMAGKDVVLYTDLVAVTSDRINVGDHTLYGNGFVIDAETYIGTNTTEDIRAIVPEFDYCTRCKKPWDSSTCNGLFGIGKHSSEKRNYVDCKGVYPAGDYYLIGIDDGTIDNIYIHGPVYPVLQYLNIDYTSNESKDYVVTPYYVSGIKSTGNSTISNSYVSGFRQPVAVEGDNTIGEAIIDENSVKDGVIKVVTEAETTIIVNSTVEGGNYANILLVTGHLTITDVTTIQKVEGYKPTVGDDSKNVIGMGIAIEDTTMVKSDSDIYKDIERIVATYSGVDAEAKREELFAVINPVIEINGYLDQYNWVKYGADVKMPAIDSLDAKTLFNYIFEGVNMDILYGAVHADVDMGELMMYIHLDKETNSSQFVNAGIVIAELGEPAESLPIYDSIVVDNRGDNNEVAFSAQRDMNLLNMVFSKTGLKKDSIEFYASDILGTKGVFTAWSYMDGRQWTTTGIDIDVGLPTYVTRVYTPVDNAVGVRLDNNDINYSNEAHYAGYYSTVSE